MTYDQIQKRQSMLAAVPFEVVLSTDWTVLLSLVRSRWVSVYTDKEGRMLTRLKKKGVEMLANNA
jgi:hypothetical protein